MKKQSVARYVQIRQRLMVRLSDLHYRSKRLLDEMATTMLDALIPNKCETWTMDEYKTFAMWLVDIQLCEKLNASIDMELDEDGERWVEPTVADDDSDELEIPDEARGFGYDWTALDQHRRG